MLPSGTSSAWACVRPICTVPASTFTMSSSGFFAGVSSRSTRGTDLPICGTLNLAGLGTLPSMMATGMLAGRLYRVSRKRYFREAVGLTATRPAPVVELT